MMRNARQTALARREELESTHVRPGGACCRWPNGRSIFVDSHEVGLRLASFAARRQGPLGRSKTLIVAVKAELHSAGFWAPS